MTDGEIPTPSTSPPLGLWMRGITAGALGLHQMLRDPAMPAAERRTLRAAFNGIAMCLLSLHEARDPARVVELNRQARATRGVVGHEPTDDEASDVLAMLLVVLDDDAR